MGSKQVRLIAIGAIGVELALGCGMANGQTNTPAGLWRTIDDESGQERSLVRVVDVNGTLSGTVERIVDPDRQAAICDLCTGRRKDQRILGMTIIEGVTNTDGDGTWEGGLILDPNKGKEYRVRLIPADNGQTLLVRGYLGPFYRTQVWRRAE